MREAKQWNVSDAVEFSRRTIGQALDRLILYTFDKIDNNEMI